MTLLSKILPGEIAVIKKFTEDSHLQTRLVAMGVVPGKKVRMIKMMPLNGTIEIKINSFHLCLRFKDAAQIIVNVNE